MNNILDKYAVGISICREGMYNGDELVLGTWKDIWKHKEGTGGPSTKGRRHTWERRCKVKYKNNLKNPVTSG